MKIVFVARCDYSLLTENIATAFTQLGYDVSVFDLKRYRLHDRYLSKAYSSRRLDSYLVKNKPDMVFVIAPISLSSQVLELLGDNRRQYGGLLVGWIGDVFELNADNRRKCSYFDRLYVTDTYLLSLIGLDAGAYLPLATDPVLFFQGKGARDINCSFVASRTDNRRDFFTKVKRTVDVFGPGWMKEAQCNKIHRFSSGGISLSATANLYSRSKSVVNIKNGVNVVNGLNQRSFDPCAAGAVLLHDYVDDLVMNFDLDKEIIVFHNSDEFEANYDRILGDSEFARRIAKAGQRRVLSEHTYLHRAQAVSDDLGF